MERIPEVDIKKRIARDNPWWENGANAILERSFPRRVYFDQFSRLALNFEIRRAAVLLGPRRVGKTVMVKQLVYHAITNLGIEPNKILYASIDTPVYSGIRLEAFLTLSPGGQQNPPDLIILDEVQYLRDWETHLKDLVDNYPQCKFVVTGSAAAALRLKSKESGAGRFSEFMLPPLTFYEFLIFSSVDANKIIKEEKTSSGKIDFIIQDIGQLNKIFVDYLNFGGYPEAVLNEQIRDNPEQFIKNDIIDKVLLKDLPSLYGIDNIQQLNALFTYLAYNAGGETSLENISQNTGVVKGTIQRYIEYLESAFLIIKVPNVDENCRKPQRARNFKVYLNNPSMRAALFAPISTDDATLIGHLSECAVFSQWQHSTSFRNLRYARWKGGEVDMVYLTNATEKPMWIGEIKWSDRLSGSGSETKNISTFLKTHSSIKSAFITSKSLEETRNIEGYSVKVTPTAKYAYMVGRNITKSTTAIFGQTEDDE